MPLVEQMQIMHDVLDIDTIFDVDTAHIYKVKYSCIYPQICRSIFHEMGSSLDIENCQF